MEARLICQLRPRVYLEHGGYGLLVRLRHILIRELLY